MHINSCCQEQSTNIIKTGHLKRRQKYLENLLVKNEENNFIFFYLHFTWLYGSWTLLRILKKSLFWKYDSCFPSAEVSKLTSVRNRPNLSLKYWLLEAKDIFWICYGPKKWSKYPLEYHYRLHLVRRITIVETFFFMSENASF